MSWDAVYAAGTAVNQQTGLARPDLDASLRAASEAAKRVGRGAAQSDGEGRYTGLPVARFQQALYAKNVEWRFTDRTLCVLWKLELPLRADYFSDIKKYIGGTRSAVNRGKHSGSNPVPPEPYIAYDTDGKPAETTRRQASRGAADAAVRYWTLQEVEFVVADYIAMLDEETAGGADLAGHNQALVPLLQNRTVEAVDSTRAAVSHALLTRGVPYLDDYQPRENTGTPVDALVVACLDAPPTAPQPAAETLLPKSSRQSAKFEHFDRLVEVPPPLAQTASEGVRVLPVGRIDYVLRDARNRELGRAGEQCVVESECRRLLDEERPDLAEKVEWVSQTRGDGLGYDIASFDGDGEPRFIEVKTTRLSSNTAFYVTRNEVAVSKREGKRYQLYRIFAFDSNRRLFILPGPLAETCLLTPTSFEAHWKPRG